MIDQDGHAIHWNRITENCLAILWMIIQMRSREIILLVMCMYVMPANSGTNGRYRIVCLIF